MLFYVIYYEKWNRSCRKRPEYCKWRSNSFFAILNWWQPLRSYYLQQLFQITEQKPTEYRISRHISYSLNCMPVGLTLTLDLFFIIVDCSIRILGVFCFSGFFRLRLSDLVPVIALSSYSAQLDFEKQNILIKILRILISRYK